MDDSKLVINEESCRICRSSEGGQLDIFGLSGAERNIPQKIRECLPINVSEKDGLPKTICTECADKLEDFYNFRELSRKIQISLNEMCQSDNNRSDSDCSNSKASEIFKDKAQLSLEVQSSSSPRMKQANLSEPHPEDYVLMKEETINVDNTIKNSNVMADYLIEFNNNAKEKNESEMQDIDILNAMRKRREVLAPMWDVFEKVCIEEKPSDLTKNGKGKPQNAKTVLKGKCSVIHRRYIIAKGAFPCSLCGRCFLFNQGRPREGLPFADADIVPDEHECNNDNNDNNDNDNIDNNDNNDNNENDNNDSSGPSDSLYSCSQCGKLFPRRTSLKRHEQTHFEGKKYLCKLCGKAFNRNEHLTRHMLSHTGGRPFQCDLCSKVFTRKEHLLRHRQGHNFYGVDKEESEEATSGYGFSDFESTDGKPFTCDICHSSYARREHMIKHKKVVHGVDIEPEAEPKPYCCDHCFKTFTRKEHLTRHKKIHMRDAFSGNYEIPDGVSPEVSISSVSGNKSQKTKKDILIPLTVNSSLSKLNNVTITPQPRTAPSKPSIVKPQISVKPVTNVTPLSMNKDTVTLEISGGSDSGEFDSKTGASLMNSILKNGKYGEISIVDVKSERRRNEEVSVSLRDAEYPDSFIECNIEEGPASGNEYDDSYYDGKKLTEEEKAQLEGFLAETSFAGSDFLSAVYGSDHTRKRKRRETDDYFEEKDSIDLDDLKKMPRCRICGKAFGKKNHLNRHLKRYHNLTKEQVSTGKYEVYENGGGGGLSCEMDDIDGEEIFDDEGNPISKRPKGTFPCTICGKAFTRRYHMYRHQKSQHGIDIPAKEERSDLKCQSCPLAFDSAEELQRHQCSKSGRTSSSGFGGRDEEEEEDLKMSAAAIALASDHRRKPKNSFKCAICKNSFESHDGFKNHECKKGYKCEVCGESFVKSKHLAKHITKHAAQTESNEGLST